MRWMDVRQFLAEAEARGWVRRVRAPVQPAFELAQVVYALREEPTLFEAVTGWPGAVVTGLCSRRRHFALALGIDEGDLLVTMVRALNAPVPPALVGSAPCQEVVVEHVDLNALPILTHLPGDGGPYVTSGVAVIGDAATGRNLAFHRLMQVGPRTFTARLVEGRGTHSAWVRAGGDLPMAVCIGAPLHVQLAAAMSPAPGVDELAIANALVETPTVRALGSNLEVPAESEIVLEGRLTHDMGDEGPFVDLTRTRDFVRQQPCFVVERITHRRDPLYQALLPGGYEHKLLMGVPREPTIFDAVSRVCDCKNVVVTPGGGYWLHAVVQIAKRSESDGVAAIEAAFRGHTSLKHVVIVDDDVDPYDTEAVEWAIATRFQAGRDAVILEEQPSSSLDPSARHVPGAKSRTSKMGLDATIAWDSPGGSSRAADYTVVDYGEVDLARYLNATEDT
ncbi:MAG: UbiD family decarboxylase [Anaerolineae bacterium]